MSWQGESNISEYFCMRGFKCLCITLMDEINELRQNAGLSQKNWSQLLTKMDGLMITHQTDDDGPDDD